MTKLIAALLVGVLVLAVAVTALGATKKRKPARRTLVADPNGGLTFDKTKLTVRHGRVIIKMRNPSSSGVPHGIGIRGHGVDKDGLTVEPGHTSTVSVRLKKPGRYTFYCPFDGHAAAGMKGKLIVK
jgi:plastocyanin